MSYGFLRKPGRQAARTLAPVPASSRLPRSRTLLLLACLLIGALTPTTALAHVKWFTDPGAYPLQTDLILSDRTLLALLSAGAAVAGVCVLERFLSRRDWPALPLFQRMTVGAPTILAVQAAIALTASAAQAKLLAPNLPLPSGPVGLALGALEMAIALTFITGIADWIGALALIALVPLSLPMAQCPLDVLEQSFWVGIGVAVLVIGRGSSAVQLPRPWFLRRDPAWTSRAVVCLRVATGLALVAVALGEKLWNPDLGHAFMVDHAAFNPLPGVVSDDLFVLLIGLAETAIGAALISGRLTRLVVLGMWLPFHLGIPLLPDQELLGHLPIFGIMYVLLVHGTQVSQVKLAVAPRSAPAPDGAGVVPTARRSISVAGRPRHRLPRRVAVSYSVSKPAASRASLRALALSRGRSTTQIAAPSRTS